MKYQRILVPYDGSEHSHAAFATARNLALASDDAIIYVINVVPMSVASSIELTEPQEQDDPAAARNEVYTDASACSRSARMSSVASMPHDRRTRSGPMPAAASSSSFIWRCVALAGCSTQVRASATCVAI